MKLTEIKKLEGTITLKSGLHIGSGNMEMHIGGTDSPVIKHPHTLEPYIPGSSLKGKVRSLLEMESGLMIYTNGNVVTKEILNKVEDKTLKQQGEAILKIFGSSGADKEDETPFGPTRVSFADCYLDEGWKEEAKKNRWFLTEEKSENVINRIKGTAEHPRFIERVPEGTKFKLLVTFKILHKEDEGLFNNVLLKGLKLLEMDAIGGNGSRGYGRIAIEFNDKATNEKFKALNPFEEVKKP
ncbi:MAG TPA: type III-A CRISPR-associated RAMP protein Csm3 [Candidatus Brocadiia bacterium]|nr:type III-A CRISPR-associated RAMP protein Csm3 [Candidatus Brocadiales bacterium]